MIKARIRMVLRHKASAEHVPQKLADAVVPELQARRMEQLDSP